ncbi:ABC transporter ATP-binding protein [Paenibacillus sp. PR3]|uniref:Putative hemin import ATP-binding protein HrtA n=1 Tax=Paenibacillus terricola TaxID=2763503 RepID=A0ABR8MX29_9BACL|nr:ABC transporter ATP-binding protein [Paenibacillus terricola]MBD3920502.1 ABC transporter ATP-binding protein [Paenibacillus terricola]
MAQGLDMHGVSHYYNEGSSRTTALDRVSISVEPGEFIAVIGPSGSGKSTFLSVAGALLQASEGEVKLNGTSISSVSAKELSRIRLHDIGFIMQSSNLVPYLNVEEQLHIIKKMAGKVTKQDKAYAAQLLDELGLGEKHKAYPDELSGGEKQRVAIARALMNDPQVILADEPTASLDTKRAHEVVSLIAKEVRSRRKAAVMVTHDERMLTYCDRVYRMADGQLTLDQMQPAQELVSR